MENYRLIKLHNEPYDFLVIATSYENPLDLIGEIEKAIAVNRAKILFDLTLINGIKSNRYIKCDFEAGKNLNSSFGLVNAVDNNIRNISYNFFAENNDIVEKSVISNALKALLRSSMI